MSLTRLTAADFKRVPWANGRGTTLELVRREDAAGSLLYRLSVADVVEPGPFSPLPGIDRVITLIDGAGFDLDFGGVQPGETLRPFEPVAFSGDWATSACAVHGPSKDFNVMTARGKVTAEVEAVTAAATVTTGPLAYVYVAKGRIDVSAPDTAVTAASGELICVEREDALALVPHPASVALVVRLTLSQ
jgi:environmental stress-induced protein Ves